jgi:hypothetical protein
MQVEIHEKYVKIFHVFSCGGSTGGSGCKILQGIGVNSGDGGLPQLKKRCRNLIGPRSVPRTMTEPVCYDDVSLRLMIRHEKVCCWVAIRVSVISNW